MPHRVAHDVCFPFDDSVLTPCDTTKFFNAHTDEIIRRCRSRLFLMKKLSTIGLNVEENFLDQYKSVISYGAQAAAGLNARQMQYRPSRRVQ